MNDDVSTMRAIEEIKTLKARYFRYIYCKDWVALRDVFTTDLKADFRDSTSPRNEALLTDGADLYIRNLASILDQIVTVHHGHMPEITLTSVNTATGIWSMEDKLWAPPGAFPWTHLHGYGHYHERYRNDAHGWRISRIRLSRLHVEVV